MLLIGGLCITDVESVGTHTLVLDRLWTMCGRNVGVAKLVFFF